MSDSVEAAIQQAAARATATGTATPIVIKEDRSIVVPTAMQQIAVQCDNEANVLHFVCPRNWADIDLAAATLYINVVKPDKSTVAFVCTNVVSSEDTVTFDWVVTEPVTDVVGKLSFLVCARDPSDPGNGYRWHSNLCDSLFIAPGIACVVPSDTPDPPHIPLYGTDTTLTEPGMPADAAVVGERLSSLSEGIVTTAASQVSAHNTGTDAHSDIRLLISGLTDRLNALADSDDTMLDQLSEVVSYIKSNRSLIEAITTSKVSVADIVDDLTTNVANKPLSAAQGVALKALIDAITVPDKLPNPNSLTFTGAVTGSYDGSAPLSVEIPSGGEPAEKTWTYLGKYDLSVANRINLTDLSNITEIYLIWADVKNGLTSSSGMVASINDIPVANGIIPVNTTTTVYGWSHLVYNGLYWDSTRSEGYKDSANVSLNKTNTMAPNNHVLDVGPAQSISLYQVSSVWGATSGTIEIYVR